MAVASCSSCSSGGTEALQAYQRRIAADVQTQQVAQQQANSRTSLVEGVNRPVAGETRGSQVNIAV